MPALALAGTGFVGLTHVYITVLEMFLWTKPQGRKAFKLTPAFAEQTKTLGANQGLYNGFLAAGLAWGLLHPVPEFASQIQLFFLGCVSVAGIFGGLTASTKIFFVQTVPAAVSIACVLAGL